MDRVEQYAAIGVLTELVDSAEAIGHPADDKSFARWSRFIRATEQGRAYLETRKDPAEAGSNHLPTGS